MGSEEDELKSKQASKKVRTLSEAGENYVLKLQQKKFIFFEFDHFKYLTSHLDLNASF